MSKTKSEPVAVPLWPDAGQALNLGKNSTYESARRKEIPVLQFGKLKRVPLWWLNRHRNGDNSPTEAPPAPPPASAPEAPSRHRRRRRRKESRAA